jgi:hypothetical protein
MTTPKCSEKACPYFAEPGQSICRYHIDMFEFDESLTDSGLDYEALSAGDDESSSGPVSQLSVTNWRDDWLAKKEKLEDSRFVRKIGIRNGVQIRLNQNLCGSCGAVKDTCRRRCATCLTFFSNYNMRQRRERNAAGLCAYCGKENLESKEYALCTKCRKKKSSAKTSRLKSETRSAKFETRSAVGKIGGKARTKVLSKQERHRIAVIAANARWHASAAKTIPPRGTDEERAESQKGAGRCERKQQRVREAIG